MYTIVQIKCFRITLFVLLGILLMACSKSESSKEIVSYLEKTIEREYDVIFDKNLNRESEYFVVFGDIQEYTVNDKTIYYYDRSVDWIINQLNAKAKIVNILEVGDVTWSNTSQQWQLFYNSTKRIAERIPYFVCTGNHDYTWDTSSKIHERTSTLINDYSHFPLSDSKIKAYYFSYSLENYVAQLSDSQKTNLLVLEFGPREEVVEWANEYVQSHPDEKFIMMTHEWMTRYGERISVGSWAETQFSGYSSYSTPEHLWQSLVKPNNNIICVLCGHNGFTGKYFSQNTTGRDVPQILFNLQYQENGGNGYLQLWEFPQGSDSVNIRVYDTINQSWVLLDSTSVSFKYKY